MKKNLKKLFAIIMTVTVVLSMALPVMAAGEETPTGYTLTINSGEKNASTTYNIYRIYSATVSEENGSIGAVYTIEPTFDSLKGTYGEDASKINDRNLQEVIKAAMNIVDQEGGLATATYSDVAAGTISVKPGYYLIVPTGMATDGGTVTSPCLVAVPGAATVNSEGDDGDILKTVSVTPKASDTSLEKKITGAAGANISSTHDSSVVAVGDTVQYTITSTIPAYGDDADLSKVIYTITDVADNTLDYQTIQSIMVGDTDIRKHEEAYSLAGTEHGFTLTFDYSKLIGIEDVSAGATITIVADFELNNTAVVAAPNNNKVTLDYTNNVYTEEKSQLKDEVNTYTFGFGIKKTDSKTGNAITGARFKVTDMNGKTVADISDSDTEGQVVIRVYDPATDEVVSTTEGDDTGNYVFAGLDEGTYTVTETKAPDGYKQMAETESVVIEAETEADGGDYTGGYTVDGAKEPEVKFGGKSAYGIEIKNTQGEILPGTGGIGTTIFTFGGLALIVLAGILLVVYTRKQKKAKV